MEAPLCRATMRICLIRSRISRQSRSSSTSTSPPFHVCVVGSGPAGFYTTQHLLKNIPNVQINMLEALPVPYGLIRYGVAPDHPEVKNVIHKFETIAQDPRFQFLGNVALDRDVSLIDLRSHFHAIVLAYGAAKDRKLNIPGEDSTQGVFGARAFVGWYNGLPEYQNLPVNLASTKQVTVVGNGNVALDVARVLLSDPERLAKTDIAEHALMQLRKSQVQRVVLLGRRGPVQVAFTAKELREIFSLPEFKIEADWKFIQSQISAAAPHLDRSKKRLMEIFLKHASTSSSSATTPEIPSSPNTPQKRVLEFKFASSPSRVLSTPDNVLTGLEVEVNSLQTVEGSNEVKAKPTGVKHVIPSQLLVRSIGYQSMAAKGLPFDDRKGVVPNDKGRVPIPDIVEGVYVAGWLKRGPTGVIVATMYDAIETADTVTADAASLLSSPQQDFKTGLQGLKDYLEKTGAKPVYFDGWKSIDSAEQHAGLEKGKPREKIVNVDNMLRQSRNTSS
ncbi:hypothetical protein SmJEL517_g03777 [Synchytrium microbalum]|uniref:NADPH:adrenodoxin oxidoreductase, mitochondrial n=1 Tax=Synchytrium microbalum TaxID=1806994 RepID=A0A507C763_9FUNG|nr:uncharacterized protein SmJEL517_g03777 [Synchytrium microbalum]TPX33325.1 hypothetical protein SmJEL517_g03777 [Synchytrium microbalum]